MVRGEKAQPHRRVSERVIPKLLGSLGCIQIIESPQSAAIARRDALRAVWALRGLGGELLDFSEESYIRRGLVSPEALALVDSKSPQHYLLSKDQWWSTARRIVGVGPRRALFEEVVVDARAGDERAKGRLTAMTDVLCERLRQPEGGLRGTIFTQTRLNLGHEPGTVSNTADQDRWYTPAANAFRGTMPYLGSAAVYAELMSTGFFKEIDFVDFRDDAAVREAISYHPDFAFVAGATTYDKEHVQRLNRALVAAEIATINGGVAPTLDPDPERYLVDGVSVFLGEFEGAGMPLMKALSNATGPHIFTRGHGGGRSSFTIDGGVSRWGLGLGKRVDMVEAYSEEKEIDGGRLARRLEALAMMRLGFNAWGKQYENPSKFEIHQINTSYGCPERCSFCATEPFQGIEMRHRSLESIERELQATEAEVVAVVDQNFTANGRDYFVAFLELLKKYEKRFAYEGELMFYLTCPEGDDPQKYMFDGTSGDTYRRELLRDTVLAIEVGLEQPVKVRGTIKNGKNPDSYSAAISSLNDMGIIVFGTAMVGLPKELWSPQRVGERPIIPYEGLDDTEWREMVRQWVEWSTQYPGLILFPFEPVPGTAAYRVLADKDLLNIDTSCSLEGSLPVLHEDPVKGIASRRALREIQAEITSPKIRRERLKKANFSPKAKAFMYIFNLGSHHVFTRMQ